MIKLTLGLVLATSCFAGTWTGQISDSSCGASHAKMMGQGGKMKTTRDCTLGCIKGGSKYVFVSAGSVYQIENQSFADLEKRAGAAGGGFSSGFLFAGGRMDATLPPINLISN